MPALPVPEREPGPNGGVTADYIRRLIFDGTLRSGNRIPQNDIAALLGVSRVPVREALIALEREGWVVMEVNRGAYVAPLSARSIQDHYEVLGIVYAAAARRAVERGDVALSERLRGVGRGFDDLNDFERVSRAALTFHTVVVAAAKSARIRSILRSIAPFVPGNFYASVPDAAALQKRSTSVIRRAISRGDADGAAAEYRRMLHRSGELVVDLLTSRGVLSSGS
ncbi:MAG TPA: GntR family transcriptional regulator [Acidimicrobiales bacterium]|nr:GntR family transcriptional regulator [Acidimicrobiales bacterium]